MVVIQPAGRWRKPVDVANDEVPIDTFGREGVCSRCDRRCGKRTVFPRINVFEQLAAQKNKASRDLDASL
jgi:hypothetical protein